MTLKAVNHNLELIQAYTAKERAKDEEVLKDQLMDEIVNFPDIIANNARPLYNTPLQPFEHENFRYVMPQGTMLSLDPTVRQLEHDLNNVLHNVVMKPYHDNIADQRLLIPERDVYKDKFSPMERARKDNFYQNLKILHNLKTPFGGDTSHGGGIKGGYVVDHRANGDVVGAIHENVNSEMF